MNPPRDLAEVVTAELLQLRRRVLALLAEEGNPAPADAQDAYVSALLGHFFAVLMTRGGTVDKSPEALADALNIIARKASVIAESLDPSADYRIQIFRREKA
ncbi:MAG TPA: hypothetical protein VMU54_24895 [Planctomycetota bacterium]|nr:hypothetical protein [Planctomycetota bacterium]